MEPIRLIATDLDHTLLKEDGSISAYTLKILKEAADFGILIVPATGRSLQQIPAEILL